MNSFSSFLKEKFGVEIYESLVEGKGKLRLKKGTKEDIYKDKLEKDIINRFGLPPNLKSEFRGSWAYDFPGWIGELLDETVGPNKEIMVVGLEPHISESAFQVTYGLRETRDGMSDEITFGNNKKLWDNLYSLLNKESEELDQQFLNRFYITDLCHFAPRGQAKLIHEIPNWKEIRKGIAMKYLPQEIDLVQPKYIVSHGKVVCDLIDNKILKKIGIEKNWKSPDELNQSFNSRYKYLPFFTKYEVKGKIIYHIGLPHLASGFTNDFWKDKKRLKYLKNELVEFEK